MKISISDLTTGYGADRNCSQADLVLALYSLAMLNGSSSSACYGNRRKARLHESEITIPIEKRTNTIDFDNFWTEELETNVIPEVTGLELQTSYDDDENQCYVLIDAEGTEVHSFGFDATIEDIYELLCKEEGVREAFEEYYATFYKEMQRLNPNGVPRSSLQSITRHTSTTSENIDDAVLKIPSITAVASEPLESASKAPAAEVVASSCLRRGAAWGVLGLNCRNRGWKF